MINFRYLFGGVAICAVAGALSGLVVGLAWVIVKSLPAIGETIIALSRG